MKAEELSPKELRIGNILTLYGETVTVQEIGNHHGSAYLTVEEKFGHGYHLDQFQPIPLSEEVLLKCSYTERQLETRRILIVEEGGFIIRPLSQSVIVKYLHQLQNLYWALTGEELEVKWS